MGRSAVVTGASRGIGKAICERFAKEGIDIVFNYSNDVNGANDTVALCEKYGVKAYAIKANVSDSAECTDFIKKALELLGGRIDILVNNAGITRDNLIMKMSDEDLDTVVDVNLKGSFYMMREVAKLMLKQRSGRIINMSSVVGLRGNAGQVNYSATKAAVIGMTKSLAKELASRKITVNAVAPGMIDTDMTKAISENAKAAFLESIPLKEAGKPEDIANAVYFLASDEARYITGQVISVDGGMSI